MKILVIKSGASVSGVGDVNGDGVADLLIGAPSAHSYAGASYLVFGHTGQWTTPFSLSTLNGTNGVKFIGNFNDESGNAVSGAGDVNGDGIADLIIGASESNNNAGASYVIFGHSGHWTSPISFSTLNGANGAKLAGENANDYCGVSVNAAGDVNADGKADFIIGAYGANNDAGASYLVFGHSGNWTTPFSLTSLNGTNGVRLNGNGGGCGYDNCGNSVSGAGDVNGDGIDDIIIGAETACTNQFSGSGVGASYVVFGHTGSWSTPFNLTNLNGVNGAKFTGVNLNDQCGKYVSGGEDFNDDGIVDLLIGCNTAKSYLIFGHTGSWATPLGLNVNGINGTQFIEPVGSEFICRICRGCEWRWDWGFYYRCS